MVYLDLLSVRERHSNTIAPISLDFLQEGGGSVLQDDPDLDSRIS